MEKRSRPKTDTAKGSPPGKIPGGIEKYIIGGVELPAIYVGPAITYLRPGATFGDVPLPKFLMRYIHECPSVMELLVPADEYNFARNDVKRVGSKLWAAARAVTDYFNSGGKT